MDSTDVPVQVLRDLWLVKWGDRAVYGAEIARQSEEIIDIGVRLITAGAMVSDELNNRVFYTLTKEQ